MRALFSYGLAFLICLVAAGWLATGTLVRGGNGPGKGETPIIALIEADPDGPLHKQLAESGMQAEVEHSETAVDPHLTIAERVAQNDDGKAVSVRIKTFVAKPMAIEVPLRGTTKAKATVTAAAETTGTVAQVLVSKGQTVNSGDLLCRLDQGTRQAAVAQAQAALAQAEVGLNKSQADLETNAALVKKGLAAENTTRPLELALEAAKAQVTASQAGLDNAQAELDRTEIYAKTSGIVQDPVADVGAMLAAGAPCATIVQLDPLVFTGNVPEARIGLAKLGLKADVTTVTGQTASGKVTYIASTSDAATRSFPIEIELPNPDGKIQAGLTASAIVNIGTAPAQLLPQSVLTLDDNGTLGVRTVENSKVTFYPITIVKDDRDGVWVTGLPMTADVITIGQENVVTGQTVDAAAVEEEGTPS